MRSGSSFPKLNALDRLGERSMKVFDRLRPFHEQKSSETLSNGQEPSGTVNDQGRWTP